MDILLAGTLGLLIVEFNAGLLSSVDRLPSRRPLWKTFRSKPNTIPLKHQNCSPS